MHRTEWSLDASGPAEVMGTEAPALRRRDISARSFWFNRYVTVILTAPAALLYGYSVLFFGINALFQNLVMILWNPLVWVVAMPIWSSCSFAPCILAAKLFVWIPSIWNKHWNVFLRLIAMGAVFWGIGIAASLLYELQWSFLHWIGAGDKAAELLSRTPSWLSGLGITDPLYRARGRPAL